MQNLNGIWSMLGKCVLVNVKAKFRDLADDIKQTELFCKHH